MNPSRLTAFPLLALLFALAAGFAASAARADDAPAPRSPETIGERVLACERALLQAPRDGALRQHLADLRAQTGATAPERGPVQTATAWLSLDAWSGLGLAALAVLALLTLYRGVRPWLPGRAGRVPEPSHRLRVALVGLCAVLVLAAATAVFVHLPDAEASVVVAGSAPLRISPFADAEASGTLPAGTQVQVEDAFGEFVRVRAGPGRKGWVARSAIEPICPRLTES